ncbi:MAG TPA: hypothetical protein VJ807_01680, partial [Gaiellaceae bacterium]|nr:hypothetical protein [Gaiellaceae bacterium]
MRQRRPPRGRQKRPSRSQRAARRSPAQAVRQAERKVKVTLPSRRVEPERVVAHLGPTNSGKTYANAGGDVRPSPTV